MQAHLDVRPRCTGSGRRPARASSGDEAALVLDGETAKVEHALHVLAMGANERVAEVRVAVARDLLKQPLAEWLARLQMLRDRPQHGVVQRVAN